jgi:hypothetical protein
MTVLGQVSGVLLLHQILVSKNSNRLRIHTQGIIMKVNLNDLVAAISAMYEYEFGRPCNFHLAGCSICGGPTNGYPCRVCHCWADASDSAALQNMARAAAEKAGLGSRESFCRNVTLAGGVGKWCLHTYRQNLAYLGEGPSRNFRGIEEWRKEPDWQYRQAIDRLFKQAEAIEWPSPEDVWDAVSDRKETLTSSWIFRADTWRQEAVQIFGEDLAEVLIRAADVKKRGFSWPENCQEGTEVVKLSATKSLDNLGILAAALGPSGDSIRI